MPAPAGLSNLFPLIILIGGMWFLLVRPQQKRARAQAEMTSKLAAGVEIVTIGGIYGTIAEADEERLLVEVADGSQLHVARRAVASIVSADDGADAVEAQGNSSIADDAESTEPRVAVGDV